MNRILTAAACAALAFLAGCGESGGEPAAGPEAGSSFVAAAAALAAKLERAQAEGVVPAPNDPAVQAFQAEAAGALETLGTPSLPVRGFDSYGELCGNTAKIVSAYVGAGTGGMPEPARAEAMNRNVEKYFDQVFTPLIFSAHCTAAHMPFIEKTVGSSELGGKADALRQVRDGAYGQVSGLLEMAGDSALEDARRRRIVDILAADAGHFAIILSIRQRQELGAMAERVGAGLPEDARAQAGRIKAGLEQAPCRRLCSI